MIVKASRETIEAVEKVFRQHDLIPMVDEKQANDGYYNIVVGVCRPGLWGINLTLVVDDG